MKKSTYTNALVNNTNRVMRDMILSCGCTVSFRTSPPTVGEVILCHPCNRPVTVIRWIEQHSTRGVA